METNQNPNRFFILTIRKDKSEELRKEIISYGHKFERLEINTTLISLKNLEFFKVYFKNRSERNALCDYCDYLNGFSDSPA